MTRRKRRRRLPLLSARRAGLLVPGGAGGCWGWEHLGRPGQGWGLLVMAAAGLLAWANLLMILGALGSVPHFLVPRQWRIWWRHRAGATRAMSAASRVPAHMQRIIRYADRGRCVYCKSAHRCEVDHIMPWAAGGRVWLWNLALLCKACNDVKSNYNKDRDGYVHYRPFGVRDVHKAARILHREQGIRVRFNPIRWFRIAWALAA